jgi:flagellar basal body-associated protein FliL
MADEPESKDTDAEGEGAPEKKGGSPIPFLVVGVLAVGLGLAMPFLLPVDGGLSQEESDPLPVPRPEISEAESVYVPFTAEGENIIVNLYGERMTRYLAIAFTMKIARESEADFLILLQEKMPPLRNWLIGNLSRNSLEDIRGPAGQHRIRREIRDEFNTILFPKGRDRIFDILFSEFAVQ